MWNISLRSCPKSRCMECWEKHEDPRDTRPHSIQGVAAIMYLASICLLPPHPKMKVVWGGVSERVIPYALMHFQASWACGESTKYQNIISLAKDKKKNYLKKRRRGGRKAPQYHSRQLALKAMRQTVGMRAANCAPVQALAATSCINLV